MNENIGDSDLVLFNAIYVLVFEWYSIYANYNEKVKMTNGFEKKERLLLCWMYTLLWSVKRNLMNLYSAKNKNENTLDLSK